MYLVVGLGNPGPKYKNTRHNLGFMVIDELRTRHGDMTFKLGQPRQGRGQRKVILLKPQTFMNNSGQAVAEAVGFYKLKPEQLIVVSDDVDLAVGQLRLRLSGSAGGHNGVQSVIDQLGSKDFVRVRLGIGRDLAIEDTADYVLSKIPAAEKNILNAAVLSAAEAIEVIIKQGLAKAMNKFNA